MLEIERKPSRREFLRNSVLNLVFIGAGLETGKMMTASELQKRTSFQLNQAEKIICDALTYASKVEKYDEKLKFLIPSVVIRAYIPGKEDPCCTLGFYDITTSMIAENDAFLDRITEAVILLIPPSFLGMRKINLVIQDIKLIDKPKKPLSLTDFEKIEQENNPERIN